MRIHELTIRITPFEMQQSVGDRMSVVKIDVKVNGHRYSGNKVLTRDDFKNRFEMYMELITREIQAIASAEGAQKVFRGGLHEYPYEKGKTFKSGEAEK